jgi:hypothetical protein
VQNDPCLFVYPSYVLFVWGEFYCAILSKFTYYMHFVCLFVNLQFVDLVHYDRVERPQDYINCIIDLREYDVPYHVRFATDKGEA